MADGRGQGLGGLAFALAWVRNPRRVGAIAPASKALAQAIAGEVARLGPELLLEVGAWSGPLLQQHATFPQSVNVGFAEVVGRDRIRLRVFERGVGETLACGSGACAAVAAQLSPAS